MKAWLKQPGSVNSMASMKMIRKVDCAARTKVAVCSRTASKRQTRSGFTAAPGNPERELHALDFSRSVAYSRDASVDK